MRTSSSQAEGAEREFQAATLRLEGNKKGVLTGVEMGFQACGIPHKPGGVAAAMDYLGGNTRGMAE